MDQWGGNTIRVIRESCEEGGSREAGGASYMHHIPGIEVDSQAGVLWLPQDKLNRLQHALQ